MNEPVETTARIKSTPTLPRLATLWRWLIEPSPYIIEAERRLQARLLMAMLLVLLLFGLLSLALMPLGFFAKPGESQAITSEYVWITVAGTLLLAAEYSISRTTRYPLAALLAVGTVLSATFLTVIVSPGDLRSLAFLILGGLIASFFLSARWTAAIFIFTFAALWTLPAFVPGFSALNNVNALFFILTVGVLVVMATEVRERYLEQIHRQTRQLRESEALLRELSIRDTLTGLFNRRYLEEVLTHEMVRAMRKGYSIGVVMADIDHFKRFNDTHGHAAGDAVLVQVSDFLRTHVRSSDVTCRYGGEEFIIILPEASREITKVRAENLRQGIGRMRVQYEEQTLEAVTLSIGIAVFPVHGSTNDSVLSAADAALYRAKQNGRNRIEIAEI